MISILVGLLAFTLAVLSGIHFYWAFGGKWGFEEALPTNLNGNAMLKPNTLSCLMVAAGLLLMALFYGLQLGFIPVNLPSWIVTYGGWILPSIFLLRTLGDFKYVGIFKKVKTTGFARRDNAYFIPICTFLFVAGYWVQYIMN